MEPLYQAAIYTPEGEKSICVFAADIREFREPIDILTVSAFSCHYHPTPGTMLRALAQTGISVMDLAEAPAMDLRLLCNVWLSEEVGPAQIPVGRIGCVETVFGGFREGEPVIDEQGLLNAIKSYFRMLDIAAIHGVKMDTVAMPLLGAGNQKISADLTLIPIINECVQFLHRNVSVRRIFFVEYSPSKAFRMARTLESTYAVTHQQPPEKVCSTPGDTLVFISHSGKDRNVAINLSAKLEARGIRTWFAPRDIHTTDYATAIAEGIRNATHFVVILSKNSMGSQHVLNEIDLAFKKLPDRIRFRPLRIDDEEFAPAFDYYLSRQHWMDANVPPLEARLNEFVDRFLEEA